MIFLHDSLLVEKIDEPEVHGMLRDEDDEEEELETLSFCEFSMNSDSDMWGESSSSRESSQNSSFKSSSLEKQEEEDSCFEFFSHQWSIGSGNQSSFSDTNPPPQDIIFCGKLISYKEPTSEKAMEGNKFRNHKKKKIKGGIFRWRWNYFSSSPRRTSTQQKGSRSAGKDHKEERSSSQIVSPGRYKPLTKEPSKSAPKQSFKKQDTLRPVHKMSTLFAAWPRWYLLFFGITKYRTKMELRDMKIRQTRSGSSGSSRRRSSSFHNNDQNSNPSSDVCINRSNGIWAVLRALSCGTSGDCCDHLTNDNVILRPSHSQRPAGSIVNSSSLNK